MAQTQVENHQIQLFDLEGGQVFVKHAPEELLNTIRNQGMQWNSLFYINLYVQVRKFEDPAIWYGGFQVTNETEVWYYTPRRQGCTCGANFTSFPKHHSEWCDSKQYE